MELLKCPFCGSDKLKVEHKNKFKDIRRNFIRMSFSVRCNSCHARGGIVTRDINYGKEAEEISKAKNEAIEKWNMRYISSLFKSLCSEMRETTAEEQKAINRCVSEQYIDTGVNIYDLLGTVENKKKGRRNETD